MILYTLDYKFLFNYIQLWWSYAIPSATTWRIFTSHYTVTLTSMSVYSANDVIGVWTHAFRPMVDILSILCELGSRA